MKETEIAGVIAKEISAQPGQVQAAMRLLDDGNTVPFIARYRKEETGGLDDDKLRGLQEQLQYYRNLVKRQQEVLTSIEQQGKLSPELMTQIEQARKLQEVEDLYLPFKPKRRTRAQVARERGLEPLAQLMLLQNTRQGTPDEIAGAYVNPEQGVENEAEALAGALDIIAETVAEDPAIRALARKFLWQHAALAAKLNADGPDTKEFLNYAEYCEPVRQMPPHRILAVNRGEYKEALKVSLETNHDGCIRLIADRVVLRPSLFEQQLREAVTDAYKRLLFPSLERELRTLLTENAEKQAIKVFGANLRALLLQPPLCGYTVMGLDPGYLHGCKTAVVDPTGRVLDTIILYPTAGEQARERSARQLTAMVERHQVNLIAIGDGTASYETQEFVAACIARNGLNLQYVVVSEAGASVYSASKLASQEFPGMDVSLRGAVSIARRIQDPLAELVKIEPKAIGVGQYQHDVDQKQLGSALGAVVETCVNHVGVELNTASGELLKYVAGVNGTVANNIIKYRDEVGPFTSRKQLLKVPRLGPAAFTQCAGFLRLQSGTNPLDNTPVHPESYELAQQLLAELGFDLKDLQDKSRLSELQQMIRHTDAGELARKLAAGEPTVRDILDAFLKPGRDPREDLPKPVTRQNVMKIDDIQVGSVIRGVVQNVTDFGAFVNIGIKNSGLVHRSQLSNQRFRHPLDVVNVGDVVECRVLSVDLERGRIGLSMKPQ